MVLARVLLVVGLLFLWVYGLLDAARADASRVRNLPKSIWQLITILVPALGSLLWLLAGKPARLAGPRGTPGVPAEYDRPGRARASNPDDDAAFLERLRKRAEEQRRGTEEHPDDDTP